MLSRFCRKSWQVVRGATGAVAGATLAPLSALRGRAHLIDAIFGGAVGLGAILYPLITRTYPVQIANSGDITIFGFSSDTAAGGIAAFGYAAGLLSVGIVYLGRHTLRLAASSAYANYHLGIIEGMKALVLNEWRGYTNSFAAFRARVLLLRFPPPAGIAAPLLVAAAAALPDLEQPEIDFTATPAYQKLGAALTTTPSEIVIIDPAKLRDFCEADSSSSKIHKQFLEYEKLYKSKAGLSDTPLKDYKSTNELITVEKTSESKRGEPIYTDTFSSIALMTHIVQEAKNPFNPNHPDDSLNDAQIILYCGLPHWINDFIKQTASQPAAEVKTDAASSAPAIASVQEVAIDISESTPVASIQQPSQAEVRALRVGYFGKILAQQKNTFKQPDTHPAGYSKLSQ